jgi:hypothetical protein
MNGIREDLEARNTGLAQTRIMLKDHDTYDAVMASVRAVRLVAPPDEWWLERAEGLLAGTDKIDGCNYAEAMTRNASWAAVRGIAPWSDVAVSWAYLAACYEFFCLAYADKSERETNEQVRSAWRDRAAFYNECARTWAIGTAWLIIERYPAHANSVLEILAA